MLRCVPLLFGAALFPRSGTPKIRRMPPPARPTSPKRARAVPASLPPASAPASSSSPVGVPASHLDVPVPPDDDDLEVEGVFIVDAGSRDLPEGWLVVDGEFAIDDAYLARTEAREKTMTVEERTKMIEAKKKELESYFKNQVWQFTTLEKGRREPSCYGPLGVNRLPADCGPLLREQPDRRAYLHEAPQKCIWARRCTFAMVARS